MKTHRFKIYGHEFETKVIRREDDHLIISVNGQEYKAYMEQPKKTSAVRPTPKLPRVATAPSDGLMKTASPSAPKGAGVIKAPLPGLILKVMVKQGDTVKVGDTVCIMEAMKMQNSIAATMAGTISDVKVNEGDSILEGQELVLINKEG